MREHGERRGGRTRVESEDSAGAASAASPGKSTLVESSFAGTPAVQRKADSSVAANSAPVQEASSGAIPRLQLGTSAVQRKVGGTAASDPATVHQAAAHGVQGAGGQLPYLDRIQRAFGRHDVSHIQAHTGGNAGEGARAMGAQAYAVGEHVAFAGAPDLHTAAHEAAHVVQQRAGVQLKGGVGQEGDSYERHADAVADKVVAGESAEDLLSTMAPSGGGKASGDAVQHKLEYAAHHAIAPVAAKDAVKADLDAYTTYAEQFELKLGAGLHQHPQAQAGADAMLRRMQAVMTRAGMNEDAQKRAFGEQNAKEAPDLGVVLLQDVQGVLDGGNLREKMSMVYHARGKISEALDRLREQPEQESQDLIGDEMKSEQMRLAIEAEKAKGKKGHTSYAILARRNSVMNQPRKGNTKELEKELSEDDMARENVPLSEREQRAATPGEDGKRRFVPGRQFYVIPPDVRKREQDDLRRVVSGISGSTDMYFHIAKHLKMPEGERRQLRLASLGQMLVNRDHSYHEIMHEAKTQGELGDYADDLPIGYTQLAPLAPNEILTTAGLTDFPGDAQIREVSSPMEKASTIETAAKPGESSKSYPAVLELLKAYEANPNKTKLQAVVAGITKWLKDKKPGSMSFKSTKTKYADRKQHLEKVLKKANYLLAMSNEFSAQNGDERGRRAQRARNTDDGSEDFLNRMGDLEGDHDNWYSPDFRATTSDMALDTQHIDIKGDENNLGFKDDIRTDLKKDTATSVGEVRWELEALNNGDGRNMPDIEPTAGPMGFRIGRLKHPRQMKKDDAQDAVRNKTSLAKNPEDFQNMDSSDIQALAPNAPLGGMLKRFEGQPVPQELEALNAYTQAGFYEMMNSVLNTRANKKFMATQEGQDWWAAVPDQLKKLISLAVSGLRKMKPYVGTVYRGDNMVRGIGDHLGKKKAERQAVWESKIPKSKTYNQFVSTSKRPYSSYAVKKGTYTATHITKVKSGIDVSALGGKLEEREVLFAPGTRFKLTAVEDRFDTTKTRSKPEDRYGSRGDEAAPNEAAEKGRIKVTFEEE